MEEKDLTENNQPEKRELNLTKEQEHAFTKDEILERSRKENSHGDERSERATLRAGYIAMVAGGLFCTVLYLLYFLLLNEVHPELFLVYTAMWAVFAWIEFYHLRRKIWLICAIAFTVAVIGFLILIILKFAGIE